jgi:hypothetical protein
MLLQVFVFLLLPFLSWASAALHFSSEQFQRIKARFPLLRPKLYLP